MRLGIAAILLFSASQLGADTRAIPPKIQKEGEKILAWVQDPVLIEAIRKQNKASTSLEEIKKLDRQWIDGVISDDFLNLKLVGPCAQKLKELQNDIPSAAESLLMDAQGALVCATKKTSDYWQGDEPKWKDAFDGGESLVFGTRNYDVSTKSTLMHISAPLKDNKKTIGVISVGINLTKLSEN